MARTIQTARRWVKPSNVWLKAWKKQSLDPNFDIVKHLKELIKYYPKNFRSLNFLTPEIEGSPQELSPEVPSLRKVLYARYNKAYIRHIEIHEDLDKRVKLISLSSLKITEPKTTPLQKTLMRTIKSIRSLELLINAYGPLADSLIWNLKKIRSITSLTIINLHPLPLKEYKRIFKPLEPRLKSLTIKGVFFLPQQSVKDPVKFPGLLEFFFKLPSLKVLNLDASEPKPLNLDCLPLDILKQKGVKFDVRLFHFGRENTLISPRNSQALSDIQVLGINNQFSFSQPEAVWDCIEEAHLDIQKNTKGNLFYINRMNITSESLLTLTNTCKNISTLNLMLIPSSELVDFASLCQLSNLQNLFIQLREMQKPLSSLFESLETLVQTHKKLEFTSFEFLGCEIGEDYTVVEPFFEASQDILKKVILKFRLTKGDTSGIEHFSNGLKKLNKITSLSLFIQDPLQIPCSITTQSCTCHYNFLANVLENLNSLTEVNLSLPQIHQDKNLFINYNLSKSIKKLSLILQYGRTCEFLVKNISKLENLQHLDLVITFFPQTLWQDISQILHGLDKLEVLRLKLASSVTLSFLENLKFLMEVKKNLKFIVLTKIGFFKRECLVLTRKGYSNGDLDGFLATGEYVIPPKAFPTKIFYYE